MDIIEIPGQDEFGIRRYFTIGFQGRRTHCAQDGKLVRVRVVQRQHGGALMG